jgi:hypothetical protein
MPTTPRLAARIRGLLMALPALTLLTTPSRAWTPAPTAADFPEFRTGALHFLPPGAIAGYLGAEYLPGVTNDLAGLKGNLLRAPTVGIHLGLSENAEFQIDWPAQGWLWVRSQRNPPALGRRLSGLTKDFGDVTVTTLIQLHRESQSWPGYGIKFAAKLPNSREQLGIGDNSTDVYASGLLAKSFASRVTVFGDVGLGILTSTTRLFQQTDVVAYGMLCDYWAGGTTHFIGEVAGRIATRISGPATGTTHELRVGIGSGLGPLSVNALVVRGLAPGDSHDLGFAVAVAGMTRLPGHRAETAPK